MSISRRRSIWRRSRCSTCSRSAPCLDYGRASAASLVDADETGNPAAASAWSVEPGTSERCGCWYAEEAVMHNEHDTKATLVLGSTGKSGRWVTAWRMQRRVLSQGRLLLRRAALRLGGPCHMGSGTARCGRRLRDLPAGCGGAGRCQNRAVIHRTGGANRDQEAGTAVRPR